MGEVLSLLALSGIEGLRIQGNVNLEDLARLATVSSKILLAGFLFLPEPERPEFPWIRFIDLFLLFWCQCFETKGKETIQFKKAKGQEKDSEVWTAVQKGDYPQDSEEKSAEGEKLPLSIMAELHVSLAPNREKLAQYYSYDQTSWQTDCKYPQQCSEFI